MSNKKYPQWDLQPAVTQLLTEQQQHLIEKLKQVGWQKTGKEIFETIMFSIFPAVPSEQAVVREVDGLYHVLMWHRDDEYYKGWHMPGGYLLRGENDFEWCARVLRKESGLELKKLEFIRRFNTRPETGWVPGQQMAHFFLCVVEGEPTVGKFYPLTALPENTLGHHRKYVDCLKAFFIRRNTMKMRGIWWDGEHRASEWKWLVVRGARDTEFDTLDSALEYCVRMAGPCVLYDDEGREILER